MARNSLGLVLTRGKRTGVAITPTAFLRTLAWGTEAGRATRAQIVSDGHALALAKTGDHFDVDIARFAELNLAGLEARRAEDVADEHALPLEDRVDGHQQHAGPIAEHDVGSRRHLRPQVGVALVQLDDQVETLLVERAIDRRSRERAHSRDSSSKTKRRERLEADRRDLSTLDPVHVRLARRRFHEHPADFRNRDESLAAGH